VTGNSFHRRPCWGTWKRAHLPGTLRRGDGRLSPQWPHWRTWGGEGSIYWKLWELAEGGHWLWKIYLYGSSVRGTWSWGSFNGGLEGYERKAMGISNSLHGGSGNLELAPLPGILGDGWKGLWRCGVSLWELCEGNLGEGFPCLGPWWIGRKGSGDRHLSP